MLEKVKETAITIAVLALIAGAIYITSVAGGASSPSGTTENNSASKEPECRTEAIPYESEEQDSEDLYVGDSEIETEGIDGEREICEQDGNEISNEITSEPTTEITNVGILEEDSYEYNNSGCPKNQYVGGYYRSNGTYVSGYWRNSPSDGCY